MDTTPDIPTLQLAKLHVMNKVHRVEKTRRMSGNGNYQYAGVEEIIAVIRPAMMQAGLTIAPVKSEMLLQDKIHLANNKDMTHSVLKMTYRLRHISGEAEDIETCGEAADSMDKSINKSMTAALKYALLQTFLLQGAYDDPDDYPSQDQVRKSARSPQVPDRQARASAPAPASTVPATAQANQATVWQPTKEQEEIIGQLRKKMQAAVKRAHSDGKIIPWESWLVHGEVTGFQMQLKALNFPDDKWVLVIRPVARVYFEAHIYPLLTVEGITEAKAWLPQIKQHAEMLGKNWADTLAKSIMDAEKLIATEREKEGV